MDNNLIKILFVKQKKTGPQLLRVKAGLSLKLPIGFMQLSVLLFQQNKKRADLSQSRINPTSNLIPKPPKGTITHTLEQVYYNG